MLTPGFIYNCKCSMCLGHYNYNFITISESETREFVSFKHGIIHKVLNILVDMYQLKIHINVEIQ